MWLRAKPKKDEGNIGSAREREEILRMPERDEANLFA